MKVTIFTELNSSMKKEEAIKSYPDGMNGCLYGFISKFHEVKMIVQKEGDTARSLPRKFSRTPTFLSGGDITITTRFPMR